MHLRVTLHLRTVLGLFLAAFMPDGNCATGMGLRRLDPACFFCLVSMYCFCPCCRVSAGEFPYAPCLLVLC